MTTLNEMSLRAVFLSELPGFESAYIGLSAGTTGTAEVSAADYQRQLYVPEYTTFLRNVNEIVWAPTSDWGEVESMFISDSAQGGNIVSYDSFTPFTPNAGMIVRVPVGGYTIT